MGHLLMDKPFLPQEEIEAMPAGPEMDVHVAREVLGWELRDNLGWGGGRYWHGHGGGYADMPEGELLEFSADPAACKLVKLHLARALIYLTYNGLEADHENG